MEQLALFEKEPPNYIVTTDGKEIECMTVEEVWKCVGWSYCSITHR